MWKLFQKKQPELLPDDANTLFTMAKATTSVERQYEYLTKAETLEPDNLLIQRELLMIGELYRRNPRYPDVTLIKYYIFHIFQEPKAHNEEETRLMAREFFDHPRLLRCLELTDKKEEFMQDYLIDMSASYIRVFLEGDSQIVPSFLGFNFSKHGADFMAHPVYRIITNIYQCPYLSEEEQKLLAKMFYRAFSREMGGQTPKLDGLLGLRLPELLS